MTLDTELRPVEPPRPFDVRDPLPAGVMVLEASAGTGKTYAIAALAARYVAEGVPLERVLLVTFTRIATGELRERVRERLVSVERGLALALAGTGPGAGAGPDAGPGASGAVGDPVDVEEDRARNVRLLELATGIALELRHVPRAVHDPHPRIREVGGQPFGRDDGA